MFRFTLYFAVLGGAVAWSVHLLAAHLIAEFGCVGNLAAITILNVMAVAWLILGASVAMVVLAGVAALAGHRAGRALRHDGGSAADIYLAHLGAITSGLFVLVIAFQSLPIFFYLRHC